METRRNRPSHLVFRHTVTGYGLGYNASYGLSICGACQRKIELHDSPLVYNVAFPFHLPRKL